jgi:hypothetical protein
VSQVFGLGLKNSIEALVKEIELFEDCSLIKLI